MRIEYRIVRTPRMEPAAPGPIALTISDWDGVHTGHVALAERAAQVAQAEGVRAVALLPWPSPDGGDNQPAQRLTTLEERLERLGALGVFDTLVVASLPGEPIGVEESLRWLMDAGDVRALIGGAPAEGALGRLWSPAVREAARAAGIRCESLAEDSPGVSEQGLSARIRSLVTEGRMAAATSALGYPYTLRGEVVGGDRRGRLLGFPTANLRADPSKLAPGNGIYAGWIVLPGGVRWPSVVSIGVRPTFGEGARRQVEAHLIDATIDLYGVQVALEFVAWLRPELRFDGVEPLIAQMVDDRERARALLASEMTAAGEGI